MPLLHEEFASGNAKDGVDFFYCFLFYVCSALPKTLKKKNVQFPNSMQFSINNCKNT